MDDNFSFQLFQVLGEILVTKQVYKQQLAYEWKYVSVANSIGLIHQLNEQLSMCHVLSLLLGIQEWIRCNPCSQEALMV